VTERIHPARLADLTYDRKEIQLDEDAEEEGCMTTQKLVAVHKAAPFYPFTIRMVDGRAHRVDHPELFAYRPGTRAAVAIGPKGEFNILDTMRICEITVEVPPDSVSSHLP
jgi:hypothetical protein